MATPDVTREYERQFDEFADDYFRTYPESGDVVVSSLGTGTYLGEPTEAADQRYREALVTALEGGCNVVDTAINYRCQRSERVVGEALDEAAVDREAVLVATKGGFLPFDGQRPPDPRQYLRETYLESGLVDPARLTHGVHCMTPEYLDDQLDRSLDNLGLDTVDLYYVHNPETQLDDHPREEVYDQLEAAFERLERRRAMGHLHGYGVATWQCFRVPEAESSFLSLREILGRARAAADAVGVDEPGFRAIQLPFNVAMAEAYIVQAQDGKSVLEVARDEGVAVFTSASIGQGDLADSLPDPVADRLPGDTAVQKAIAFARSAPGVTSSLVGTGRPEHVEENLAAGRFEGLSSEEFAELVEGE